MALKSCNASTMHDVSVAKKRMHRELALDMHPCKNVFKLTVEAQWLTVKAQWLNVIVRTDHALECDIGFTLLHKVCTTSSHEEFS